MGLTRRNGRIRLRLLPSRSDHDVPNSHVLEDAASVVVTLVDGNQYNSNVIG
jgi:hypothetical protein